MSDPLKQPSAQLRGLSLCSVSKQFRLPDGSEFVALSDVSLSLPDNHIGVLLGPSGCGKSTLLRMVAGLETVDSGTITLQGQPVSGAGADRAMVFQSYSSFPWLTVRDNVAFGLQSRGERLTLREGVVDHFLDAVQLTRFAQAYPHQLSGGMQQRVALARTLASNPQLLLMDEPFGALDPETRWQMQALLLEIVRKEKTTVLMVSHDIEEALYLGDIIYFMGTKPGRICETIVPGLERDTQDRDAILELPTYRALERDIRLKMRSQALHI
jgi:NitT/TauT family transport system ATP-binding protein